MYEIYGMKIKLLRFVVFTVKSTVKPKHILKDFRNAVFYSHRLFHLADLRRFLYHFLSAYTMDNDLP